MAGFEAFFDLSISACTSWLAGGGVISSELLARKRGSLGLAGVVLKQINA